MRIKTSYTALAEPGVQINHFQYTIWRNLSQQHASHCAVSKSFPVIEWAHIFGWRIGGLGRSVGLDTF